MRNVIAAITVAVAFSPLGVSAYNESHEVPRFNPPSPIASPQANNDDWFMKERMRTDGYLPSERERTATPDIACPMGSGARRDREFWQQLQLTEGVTTSTATPLPAVAVANVPRGEMGGRQLAASCHGLMQGS